MTAGADHSRLKAMAEEDEVLFQDPTIREVLAGKISDDDALDDDELEKYIQELEPN